MPYERLKVPLYDLNLEDVPVVYSNAGLSPFEGGALFFDPVRIQLRTRFEKGNFWIYSREELLMHEAVHAARADLDEPRFEEILAYQTSPNRWRRFWGPLFARPWEANLFLGLFVLGLGGALGISLWTVLLPTSYLAVLSTRLIYRQRLFKRCVQRLSYPAVLRMTDQEIQEAGRWMQ